MKKPIVLLNDRYDNLINFVRLIPYEKLKNNSYLHVKYVKEVFYIKDNKDNLFPDITDEQKMDIRNNKSKIIIIAFYEGYSGSLGNYDLEILNDWFIKENFPLNSLYYITGNLLIENIVKDKNILFNVMSMQSFEVWNFHYIKNFKNIEYKPIDDKNLYLCYNRRISDHRLFLLNELIDKDLIDVGLISFFLKDDIEKLEFMSDKTFNYINDNKPFLIDSKTNLNENQAININITDYERTFISLVSETLDVEDSLFISEKTWKPIITGHPFMIYGTRNSLKYLKSLGYKTFEKWIDESYDTEALSFDRCRLIVKEIEKFSKLSTDELKNLRIDMNSICEFNKNRFIESVNKNYYMLGYRGYVNNSYVNNGLVNLFDLLWKDLDHSTDQLNEKLI